MSIRLLLVHGPNLNLLGERETTRYGLKTTEEIVAELNDYSKSVQVDLFQSNSETELIESIQIAKKSYHGILINAGAFSHSSIALSDAIRSIDLPVISVHITAIHQREPYRQIDVVGEACHGSIIGLGTDGYRLALECLLDLISEKGNT